MYPVEQKNATNISDVATEVLSGNAQRTMKNFF